MEDCKQAGEAWQKSAKGKGMPCITVESAPSRSGTPDSSGQQGAEQLGADASDAHTAAPSVPGQKLQPSAAFQDVTKVLECVLNESKNPPGTFEVGYPREDFILTFWRTRYALLTRYYCTVRARNAAYGLHL